MNDSVWKKGLAALLFVCVVLLSIWTISHWLTVGRHQVDDDSEVLSSKLSYQRLRNKNESIGGNWLRTLNPRVRDVQGDLIWNESLQQGVMRFINLPDPGKGFEYFLWVYDSHAKASQPVLAAVMARGAGKQEIFVDIEPDEAITKPYKFVLTMEASGQREPTDDSIMLMVQP